MLVEPAVVSRDPAAATREEPAESAIRLVELADVWPPPGDEEATGTEPARSGHVRPPAADPGPVLPRQFALFLIEGLAGVRPVRQLMPWMTKRGSVHLHRLMPLFSGGHQPKVLRVLTARPAPNVVEMTMVVRTSTRVRAVAVRLEHAGRWLCTDIEAG